MPARRHLRRLHHTGPDTERHSHAERDPDTVGHPDTHAEQHAQRDPDTVRYPVGHTDTDTDTLRAR